MTPAFETMCPTSNARGIPAKPPTAAKIRSELPDYIPNLAANPSVVTFKMSGGVLENI